MNGYKTLPLLFAAAMLSACSGTDERETGRLDLRITDAPVDAAREVVVEFTGVELRPAEGDPISIDFDAPRRIDLLALTGGETELLLEDRELPAGRYTQIRLKVNAGRHASDSYLVSATGGRHTLFIPSGNESGLKLSGITIPAGGRADFTIDFDLRKSVTNPHGFDGYILRPTLRLVDNTRVGAIAGRVDPSFIVEGCEPAVYIYTGTETILGQLGSDNEPLSSARVTMDEDGRYHYRAAFLPAGPYTVALTCDAGNDDPELADDEVEFLGEDAVPVEAGRTARADFAP